MSRTHDLLTVAQAAEELGIGTSGVRMAITYGTLRPVRFDRRSNLIPREEVERYRREHLGQRGKRKKKKPATEPAE